MGEFFTLVGSRVCIQKLNPSVLTPHGLSFISVEYPPHACSHTSIRKNPGPVSRLDCGDGQTKKRACPAIRNNSSFLVESRLHHDMHGMNRGRNSHRKINPATPHPLTIGWRVHPGEQCLHLKTEPWFGTTHTITYLSSISASCMQSRLKSKDPRSSRKTWCSEHASERIVAFLA